MRVDLEPSEGLVTTMGMVCTGKGRGRYREGHVRRKGEGQVERGRGLTESVIW